MQYFRLQLIYIYSSYLDGDVEGISSMEETALRSLKELEVKQDQRTSQLNDLFSEIKEDEISRHEKEEKIREENKRKANEEHRMKMTENEVGSLNIPAQKNKQCKPKEKFV